MYRLNHLITATVLFVYGLWEKSMGTFGLIA